MKPTTLPESILSIRKPTIDTDSMQGKESHYSSHASIRSLSTREKSLTRDLFYRTASNGIGCFLRLVFLLERAWSGASLNSNLGLNSAFSKEIVNRPDQVVFNNLPTVRVKKTWESINLKDRGGTAPNQGSGYVQYVPPYSRHAMVPRGRNAVGSSSPTLDSRDSWAVSRRSSIRTFASTLS